MKKKESKLPGAWTFRNEQTEWMNEMVRKPEAIVHIRVYWTIGFTLQVYIMLKCNFVQKFLFLFGILAMPTMNNVNQGPFHYSSGHFILLVFFSFEAGQHLQLCSSFIHQNFKWSNYSVIMSHLLQNNGTSLWATVLVRNCLICFIWQKTQEDAQANLNL